MPRHLCVTHCTLLLLGSCQRPRRRRLPLPPAPACALPPLSLPRLHAIAQGWAECRERGGPVPHQLPPCGHRTPQPLSARWRRKKKKGVAGRASKLIRAASTAPPPPASHLSGQGGLVEVKAESRRWAAAGRKKKVCCTGVTRTSQNTHSDSVWAAKGLNITSARGIHVKNRPSLSFVYSVITINIAVFIYSDQTLIIPSEPWWGGVGRYREGWGGQRRVPRAAPTPTPGGSVPHHT